MAKAPAPKPLTTKGTSSQVKRPRPGVESTDAKRQGEGPAQEQESESEQPQEPEPEPIETSQEHEQMTLVDLHALNLKLLLEVEELQLQRRSIKAVINERHKTHIASRDLSLVSPEEMEEVNAGEKDFEELIREKQDQRTQEQKRHTAKSSAPKSEELEEPEESEK